MMEEARIRPIARIRTAFPEKFGLPRQSGVVPALKGAIFFASEYREREALRGLEDFSHLWLLWQFSAHAEAAEAGEWSPTVRPPRLGGNERVGVFASRSPYRPNALGLSLVKLERLVLGREEETAEDLALLAAIREAGEAIPPREERYPYLLVSGVDMLDGSPLFDIKPYLPYAEAIPGARGGFTEGAWKQTGKTPGTGGSDGVAPKVQDSGDAPGVSYARENASLDVEMEEALREQLGSREAEIIRALLAADPRPSYQEDPERIYGMRYGRHNVKFRVEEGKAILLALEEATQ